MIDAYDAHNDPADAVDVWASITEATEGLDDALEEIR